MQVVEKLKAIAKLTRFEHSVMLVIAVVSAELIVSSGSLPSNFILALSAVTPIFISMGAFAVNDYFDIAADKANKKMRPLVIGTLKPKDALYITFLSMATGLVASFLINIECFEISMLFAVAALLYSYKLKEIPFIGNAYVAFSMAIPFLFGNFVVASQINFGIGLVTFMVFFSGLGREIHGTVRDYLGDKKMRNAKTLAILLGRRIASYAAMLSYAFAVALSVYLFLYVKPFSHNIAFALLILISDIAFAYVSLGFLLTKKQAFYDISGNISLAAMALALFAILAAAL